MFHPSTLLWRCKLPGTPEEASAPGAPKDLHRFSESLGWAWLCGAWDVGRIMWVRD